MKPQKNSMQDLNRAVYKATVVGWPNTMWIARHESGLVAWGYSAKEAETNLEHWLKDENAGIAA
jgi:hypothetical protein